LEILTRQNDPVTINEYYCAFETCKTPLESNSQKLQNKAGYTVCYMQITARF